MLQSLIDTKKEYIEHIQDLLGIPIAEKIYTIYMDCQKKGLRHFQYELNQIPKWNNYTIEQETKVVLDKSKCTYLNKLLKLTIMTSVKIKLYEFKYNVSNKELLKNIDIPNVSDFVHKCFINASQFAWKNPYLFVQTNLKSVEIQNNLNIIEHNIRKVVAKTIKECVNIKEIIEYIDEMISNTEKKKKKNTKKQSYNESLQSSESEAESIHEAEDDEEAEDEDDEDDEVDEEAEEAEDDEVDEDDAKKNENKHLDNENKHLDNDNEHVDDDENKHLDNENKHLDNENKHVENDNEHVDDDENNGNEHLESDSYDDEEYDRDHKYYQSKNKDNKDSEDDTDTDTGEDSVVIESDSEEDIQQVAENIKVVNIDPISDKSSSRNKKRPSFF